MKIFFNTKCKSHTSILRFRNSFLVLTLFCLTVMSVFSTLLKWNIICLNLDVQFRLNKLCKDFQEGVVYGDMCHPLCGNQISISSCYPMHKGKVTVFTAMWNNTWVVIKNSKLKSEYIPIEETNYNSSSNFPTSEDFTEMVVQSLQINFGIHGDNILKIVYPFVDFHKNISNNLMVNLWELSQDNEYVTLMLYSHSKRFPKVLGTCGTFYATEYAKPISTINVLHSENMLSKNVRAQTANLLIELVEDLEESFPHPLHMCDVKLEHFGLLDGRMVLLDVDTVFPKPIIDRSVADKRKCAKDSDCDFFDCRSLCNQSLHVCDSPVINNNLQLVCQKIFLDSYLLTSESFPKTIEGVLKKCANPFSSLDQTTVTTNIIKKLIKYLK